MTLVGEECIRIAIVAPQMMGWGLQRLVQSSPRFEFVASASDLTSAARTGSLDGADVMLVDLDDASGVNAMIGLLGTIKARMVVLTGLTDLAVFDKAVLLGLQGVVRKSEPPTTLLKALEKVHLGELWIDRSATSRIFMEVARQKAARQDDPELARIATLTVRERQTIVAVAADTAAPGKVIASRLCISEHTLRNHLSSIYSKLELSNRLDLYAFATRHRLDKPQA